MRKIEQIVGNEFTRRRKVVEQTENNEELGETLKEMSLRLQDPWGQQRPLREWIESALAVEVAGKPEGYQFKEREDAGWYFKEMRMHGDIVDRNIAKGDASWAANHGALYGELWAEFQLLMARKDLFLIGKRAKDHSDDGAAMRRKASVEERRAAVTELVARGHSVRNACRLVAKREGSSEKTIQKDYYNKK